MVKVIRMCKTVLVCIVDIIKRCRKKRDQGKRAVHDRHVIQLS